MGKDALSTKRVGDHPKFLYIESGMLDKVQDLRYGTNPSQTAALYNPNSFLGSLKELRTGKEGASQTNMEDIFYAAVMVGYFVHPAVMIMKHENPSGFAAGLTLEPLSHTYRKARDADFRAAFGGTVFFNRPVDMETAETTKELFTEVVVAPGYEEGVVASFKGSTRAFEYDEKAFRKIPRHPGEELEPELKRLSDGSVIRSDAYLLPIRNETDLEKYVVSRQQPTNSQLFDLLTGCRLNKLRSNSIRLVKNGYTTALGVGQQDRVMCIDIAAYKNFRLAELAKKEGVERIADYTISGSVLVSDGFFPFTDSVELAHELGATALLAPHGGQRFTEVLSKADEYGMVFVDLPAEMRFFEHH